MGLCITYRKASAMELDAWPRWFHKCQLKYIIDGKCSFSCESILSEYLPALYKLTCNIKENNYNEAELIEWVNLRNLDVSKNIVYNVYNVQYFEYINIIIINLNLG